MKKVRINFDLERFIFGFTTDDYHIGKEISFYFMWFSIHLNFGDRDESIF